MNARLFLATVACAFAIPSICSSSEPTRSYFPNVLSVEALGKGLLISLNYDRMLDADFAAGFGIGRTRTEADASGKAGEAILVPLYLNYYFRSWAGDFSPYLTGGVDVVLGADELEGQGASPSTLQFPGTHVIPFAGVGYEYRSPINFTFRGTAYLLLGDGLAPWFGLSVGYAF